jgi:G3E family GTPase
VQADADLDALFAPRRMRSAQDLQQWAKSVGGKAVTRLSHLRSERLESFAVETDGSFDVDRLRAYLRGLPREIFRVKGFVRLAGKVGFAFVNQIGDRVRVFEEVALEPPPRRNVLVFIGTEAGGSRDTIARGLSTLQSKGS